MYRVTIRSFCSHTSSATLNSTPIEMPSSMAGMRSSTNSTSMSIRSRSIGLRFLRLSSTAITAPAVTDTWLSAVECFRSSRITRLNTGTNTAPPPTPAELAIAAPVKKTSAPSSALRVVTSSESMSSSGSSPSCGSVVAIGVSVEFQRGSPVAWAAPPAWPATLAAVGLLTSSRAEAASARQQRARPTRARAVRRRGMPTSWASAGNDCTAGKVQLEPVERRQVLREERAGFLTTASTSNQMT
mmetsp:Transcript_5402/g.13672  ORF Transcript_5402/g.13672 Transcript_5402/m.13672 type:complete len:243 (+) Transcript_5402:1004-1732(+)